jgi:hypothetical protein
MGRLWVPREGGFGRAGLNGCETGFGAFVSSRNISGTNVCGIRPGVGEEVIFPGDAVPYDAGDVPKVLLLFGVMSQRFLWLRNYHNAS